ncbi:hypothetical protein NESM_000072000 [Novymonas esmeraldas]|uniref:Uncharacterized protein n=1 Tax=Novymonas esmeraldas TaxID=1808958 RepID=A0AAW0F2T5_9TRYP
MNTVAGDLQRAHAALLLTDAYSVSSDRGHELLTAVKNDPLAQILGFVQRRCSLAMAAASPISRLYAELCASLERSDILWIDTSGNRVCVTSSSAGTREST